MRTILSIALLSLAIHFAWTLDEDEAYDGQLCNRECDDETETGRTCKFHFVLEYYHTMNRDCGDCPRNLTDCQNAYCIPADGVPRAIAVINKQLPGPLIKVCRGDHIVVDVTNHLPSDTTTIHWHGLLQERTQYFDGVPYVTQCPINPGETFRYQFEADRSGTYFYHSHAGIQRTDGISGPLIIKDQQTDDDPIAKLYDHDLDEHVITVFDWDHELALSKYEGVLHWVNGSNEPHSMLVNGLGRNKTYRDGDDRMVYTPTARFHVKKGSTYRFRLINSGNLDCPIQVSIDGHNMTVISSDGNDFEPVEVESLMTLAGERYDFVLNASQEVATYWMKFRGDIMCVTNEARQLAVLHYDGAPINSYPTAYTPTFSDCNRTGLQLNPLNKGTEDNRTIALPKLIAKEPMEDVLREEPTFVYFMPFDLNRIYNPRFRTDDYPTPQINGITNKNLPFPLLSQRNQLRDSMFCNESVVSDCKRSFCECTYLVKIPLYSIVELVLINEAKNFAVNHPFHLHGYKFRVIAIEDLGERTSLDEVKRLYEEKKIAKNLNDPPLKDTVNAPDGGYTVIKFHATNPGFWIMHCHVDHHVEEGMSLVFQVGEYEEMPSVPQQFPRCGNYLPKINYNS